MTPYQTWLMNIGLTEELADELTAEEIFNRINSIPVVIELDKDCKLKAVWTINHGSDQEVQVFINQTGSTPQFVAGSNLPVFLN